MTTATSQLATEIRNSGLSRQAWFEQEIEQPVIGEGDSVWFASKYGFTGIGQVYAIHQDTQELVIVNKDAAFTLDCQAEWDTVVLLEKAEVMPMFAHITFASIVKNVIAAIVA